MNELCYTWAKRHWNNHVDKTPVGSKVVESDHIAEKIK